MGATTTVDASVETTADAGQSPDAGSPPGEDSGALLFAVGTYTQCAQGAIGDNWGSTGFVPGATLTLTQTGRTLSAQYVSGAASTPVTFALTGSASATLAPAGQAFPLPSLGESCGAAAAGALIYDANAVFVSMLGAPDASAAGPCGPNGGGVGVWIVCAAEDGGAPGPSVDAGPPVPTPAFPFPVGDYACDSQPDLLLVGGESSGTLTLTQTGAELTAAYVGDDPQLTGTLRFAITSAASAIVEPGQSLSGTCEAPPMTPAPLSVASASLAVVDNTLFVSYAGVLSGACAGDQAEGTLMCTPMP
jgi:hypothetical protein